MTNWAFKNWTYQYIELFFYKILLYKIALRPTGVSSCVFMARLCSSHLHNKPNNGGVWNLHFESWKLKAASSHWGPQVSAQHWNMTLNWMHYSLFRSAEVITILHGFTLYFFFSLWKDYIIFNDVRMLKAVFLIH